ncbi:cellulase family glycosylhydrolase [Edaphobacter paludis]|uniref:Cellulase family glycosylhydrolase n=1 Tax=Edaphobacter paludis TaxID=3035702 RepID=A0AAU7D114_9BACT
MPRWPQRFVLTLTLALICATLILPAAFSQTPDTDLAFHRAKNLQRGINASIWFAQSPQDYTVHRLETFTTANDIAFMEKLGLDHVRLSIDPEPLLPWLREPGTVTPFMAELDKTIHTILAHHLSVIIDIHPESSYKAPLLHGTASVQQFTSLWRALAAHYANLDPEHVFFEIMNEPEQDDPFRWQGIESTVAAAIRQVAPNNTIIAAGAHYSGLDDLMQLQPISQPNVIYTFHDYEPFPFTHQGATWTSPEVRPLRGIPYPSSPEDIAPLLQQEPDLHSQLFLEDYGLGRWDAARIDSTIAFAARWSQLHHAPVYCGEFGALRYFAPPAMRAQWTHDMRVAFEKYNIGWAMWDYQTNFGLVTKANGTTSPDPAIVTALGLHMPSQ